MKGRKHPTNEQGLIRPERTPPGHGIISPPRLTTRSRIVFTFDCDKLTTRFARGTETQRVTALLLCREIAAQQKHHACGAVILVRPCPKGEGFCPDRVLPVGAKASYPLCLSVSVVKACKQLNALRISSRTVPVFPPGLRPFSRSRPGRKGSSWPRSLPYSCPGPSERRFRRG